MHFFQKCRPDPDINVTGHCFSAWIIFFKQNFYFYIRKPLQPIMRIALYMNIMLFLAVLVHGQQEGRREAISDQLSVTTIDSARTRLLSELALEYKISDTLQAMKILREAEELAAKTSDARGLGLCCEARGKIRYYHGYYEKAIRDFERSKSYFIHAELPGKFAGVMVDQGNAHLFLSQYDIALSKYDSARRFFEEMNHVSGLIRCLNNMGIIYKNYGRYREALDSYQQVIDLSLSNSDSISLTDTYINIGVVYVRQGDYSNALENFNKSLYYARQTNNKKQESISLLNKGVIYYKLREYEESLEHYMRALEVSSQMGDKVEISRCLTNIGTNYISMGQYDRAESYIKKALTIKKELGDKRSIANNYNFLAEVEYYRENFTEAIALDMKAILLKHEVNDPDGLARCFNTLGRTYLADGQFEQAFRYADSSLHYGLSIGALEHITDAYFLQKEVMEQRENYKEAYERYDLYKMYSDSLMNERKARAIKDIQFRYESRVLEEENERLKVQADLDALLIERNRKIMLTLVPAIILFTFAIILLFTIQRRQKHYNAALTRQNQVITRQNLKLDDHNRTKDKILSVITHDIRGTLGNQFTALSVLARGQFKDENERIVVFSRLAQSAALSIGMLENLALWTRLREGSLEYNPEKIDLSEVINEVTDHADKLVCNKEILLYRDSPGGMTCQADRRMIRNILANLVSNAIKYSYRGGEVQIAVEKKQHRLHVTVKDQGIGLSEGELLQLSDENLIKGRRGTENEKGSGLGLTLVKRFLAYHKSELLLESTPDEGTTASFMLSCIAHD